MFPPTTSEASPEISTFSVTVLTTDKGAEVGNTGYTHWTGVATAVSVSRGSRLGATGGKHGVSVLIGPVRNS